MRFPRLLILFLTSVALVGCSLKLQVALFNNAGEAVTVKMGGTIITIEPDRYAQFDYPGEEQSWTLHLSTARCDYVYQVPRTLEHYPSTPGQNGPLKVQMDRDLNIYLLPPSATVVTSVAGVRSLQQDGFPLHPMSKNCR